MGRLQASEIEQVEPRPPNFPEEEIFGFTLFDRLLPSVPTFLWLTSGTIVAAIFYRTGHIAKVTQSIVNKWHL